MNIRILGVIAAGMLIPVAPVMADAEKKKGKRAKVTLCHVPPGNPANAHTITVGPKGAKAHLRRHAGDKLGPCKPKPDPDPDPDTHTNPDGDSDTDGHTHPHSHTNAVSRPARPSRSPRASRPSRRPWSTR